MSKEPNQENQPEEEDLVTDEIRKLNKSWYTNPYLVVASLILGPATFVGAFFIDYYTVWHSAIQTIVFLISAGFLVIILSYGFNLLWLYSLKKKTNGDYFILTAIQLGVIIPLIINTVQIIPYISSEKVYGSSIFLILTIVYFIVAGILGTTTYFTVRKIKQPINTNEYIVYGVAVILGVIFALATYYGVFFFDKFSINHVFG
ncbi:MAG: hypothetical protein ACTSSN_09715 [Candidatus Heimdallarchaeaceae archaeon]